MYWHFSTSFHFNKNIFNLKMFEIRISKQLTKIERFWIEWGSAWTPSLFWIQWIFQFHIFCALNVFYEVTYNFVNKPYEAYSFNFSSMVELYDIVTIFIDLKWLCYSTYLESLAKQTHDSFHNEMWNFVIENVLLYNRCDGKLVEETSFQKNATRKKSSNETWCVHT